MNFLTANEAADLLRVKIDTLYSLIEKDALPGAKVGGQWRFLEDELISWFKLRQGGQAKAENAASNPNSEDAALADIYRKFVAATFDAVLITKDKVIFDCNEVAASLYGYTQSSLVGSPTNSLVVPEFHDSVGWDTNADRTGVFQSVHRCADGTVFPVEISVKTILFGEHCIRITAIRSISQFNRNYLSPKVVSVLDSYSVRSIAPGINKTARPYHKEN